MEELIGDHEIDEAFEVDVGAKVFVVAAREATSAMYMLVEFRMQEE
jgi:hypothetical protein